MTERVAFDDNLYGDSPMLVAKYGGAGLKGFVRVASWYYARHDSGCKPGMWQVSLASPESGEFWQLLNHRADAVVDDFGNLQVVGLQ